MSREEWARDDEENARHYGDCLRRHRTGARALDWGSDRSQWLRFQALAEIGALEGSRILDVGCGRADLCAYMRERGLTIEYTGLDLLPEMTAAATGRFPRMRFLTGGALETARVLGREIAEGATAYDWVFMSGLFVLRRHEPLAWLREVLEAYWPLCRRGLGFNTLRPRPADLDDEFRPPLGEVLEVAEPLTPWFRVVADYHPGDHTFHLLKDAVDLGTQPSL